MPSDVFLMDHGSGHTSTLYRQEIKLFGRARTVWRETRPGEPHPKGALQFDDDEGRPVDGFWLPIFGKFVDVFI